MKRSGWGILFSLILLAGCRSPADIPLPTAMPLVQNQPADPAPPLPTATLQPTTPSLALPTPSTPPLPEQAGVTSTPITDQRKAPTPGPATADAVATLDAFPAPCGEDNRIGDWPLIESISPNGKWAAYQCFSSDTGNFITVVSVDGTISYRASFADTYAAVPGSADGDTALTLPTHWSSDGRYLFLRTVFPQMTAPGVSFTDGHGLYRLNLLGGRLEQILPPVSGAEGYAIRLSPDGRLIAYTRPGEDAVFHVRELETGSEVVYRMEAQYTAIGFFAWSDDGSLLAFSAEQEGQAGYTVLVLDRRSHIARPLAIDSQERYRVEKWISGSELLLTSLDAGPGDPPLTYNVDTQTFSNP